MVILVAFFLRYRANKRTDNFYARNHSPGAAEAIVAKFCVQEEYMTDHPIIGVVRVTGPFLIFPNHICGMGEAKTSKFRVLIDTVEYECMHDILLPKRCVQSHVTSLHFGK